MDSKNKVDTHFILSVYEKIITHGEPVSTDDIHDMYHLEGITAYSDFDGYTVYLEDGQVKLWTGFHNTFQFEQDTYRAFENFIAKMKQIEKNYG